MKIASRVARVLCALVVLGMTPSAFATAAHWQNTYWISLNFSPFFDNAQVTSVVAHLRVLTANGALAGEASNIVLDKKNQSDHRSFFKEAEVSGSSTNDPITGVMVTYEVNLADGRRIPEGQPVAVPLIMRYETFPGSPSSNPADFRKVLGTLNNTTATMGVGLSQGWAD